MGNPLGLRHRGLSIIVYQNPESFKENKGGQVTLEKNCVSADTKVYELKDGLMGRSLTILTKGSR